MMHDSKMLRYIPSEHRKLFLQPTLMVESLKALSQPVQPYQISMEVVCFVWNKTGTVYLEQDITDMNGRGGVSNASNDYHGMK